MNIEFYFAMSLLFFMVVHAVLKAESYVESHVFGNNDKFYSALNSFCSNHKRIGHDSDEYYCFFKKSAFDFD